MQLPVSPDETWHAKPTEDVFTALETSSTGLLTQEATRRLHQVGPNLLAQIHSESVLQLIFRQLCNPLIYVLLAAATLAFVLGKTTDAMVVLGVVVLNTNIWCGAGVPGRPGDKRLALETMEPDVMRRPSRKPDAPIFSKFVFFRMITVALVMAAGTIGLFLWNTSRK